MRNIRWINNPMITISVVRPEHGVSLSIFRLGDLQRFPSIKIFPDNKGPAESSFPMEWVSITSKPQGHVVIAHQHLERWILSGFSCENIDLGAFSEHWKGCSMTLMVEDC